jgi:hypothetical protein
MKFVSAFIPTIFLFHFSSADEGTLRNLGRSKTAVLASVCPCFADETVNQMTAEELKLGKKWSSGNPVEKNQIDFEFISHITGEWIHMTISEYVNHNAYCYSRSETFLVDDANIAGFEHYDTHFYGNGLSDANKQACFGLMENKFMELCDAKCTTHPELDLDGCPCL